MFQNIQNGGHFCFYVHVIMAHLSTPPPKQTLSNRPTYLGVIKIRLLCSSLNARVHKLKEQTKSLPSNHLRSGRLISGYLINILRIAKRVPVEHPQFAGENN